MGICFSDKNNDGENKSTDNDVDVDDEKKQFKKLLLLGAGWSGKSTVFKQMKVLYGNGFDIEERRGLRWTIYQNVYMAMKALCEENKDGKYGDNDPDKAEDFNFLRNYEDDEDTRSLTKELGLKIQNLWGDPAIKKTYEHRTEFFFFLMMKCIISSTTLRE